MKYFTPEKGWSKQLLKPCHDSYVNICKFILKYPAQIRAFLSGLTVVGLDLEGIQEHQ